MENNPKNKSLLVIIIILLVVGLVYFLLNKTKKDDVSNFQKENQIVDNILLQKETKEYINMEMGYKINYPLNWILGVKSNTEQENIFQIKNIEPIILDGDTLNPSGSSIVIRVVKNISHNTLEDMFKDIQYGSIEAEKEAKSSGSEQVALQYNLSKIKTINIGGKIIEVHYIKDTTTEGYHFIYNNKLYNIDFMSGSETQFNKDQKVFIDLMSSFSVL